MEAQLVQSGRASFPNYSCNSSSHSLFIFTYLEAWELWWLCDELEGFVEMSILFACSSLIWKVLFLVLKFHTQGDRFVAASKKKNKGEKGNWYDSCTEFELRLSSFF